MVFRSFLGSSAPLISSSMFKASILRIFIGLYGPKHMSLTLRELPTASELDNGTCPLRPCEKLNSSSHLSPNKPQSFAFSTMSTGGFGATSAPRRSWSRCWRSRSRPSSTGQSRARIDVRTGQPYPAYKPSGVDWLGDVPTHWEARRLKWVTRLQRGYDLPADSRLPRPSSRSVLWRSNRHAH